MTWCSYHLVGRVVSLELLVSGVLHVNGVVSDVGRDGRVVIHHCLSTLLTVEFQECLKGQSKEALHFSKNTVKKSHPEASTCRR